MTDGLVPHFPFCSEYVSICRVCVCVCVCVCVYFWQVREFVSVFLLWDGGVPCLAFCPPLDPPNAGLLILLSLTLFVVN